MKTTKTAPAVKVNGCETDINGIEVYSVPSETMPGTVYQVLYVDGRTICACRAAQFGRHCKHVAAVDKFRWLEETATTRRDSAPLYRSNAGFSLFKAS